MKTADVLPSPTATEAGAVSRLLTTDRRTLAPPAGAFLLNVTVQVLEDDGPKVVGTQTSEDTSTGATKLTLAPAELLL